MDLSKKKNANDIKNIQNSKEIKLLENILKKNNIFKRFKNTVFGNTRVIRSKKNNNINYAGNILSVVIGRINGLLCNETRIYKCSCSQSRKRTYIKYFNITFCIIILGITILTYYNDNFIKGKKKYTHLNLIILLPLKISLLFLSF